MCAHVHMHTTLVTHAFGHQVSSLGNLQNVFSFPLLFYHPLLLHCAPSFMTMISNDNKSNPSPPNVSHPQNLSPLEMGAESEEKSWYPQCGLLIVLSPRQTGHERQKASEGCVLGVPQAGPWGGGRVKNSARMWDLKSRSRSSRPLRTMRLDERGVICNC